MNRCFSTATRFARYKRIVLAAVTMLPLAACSDSITNSEPGPFSLHIRVTDDTGSPVTGLRVDAWSVLSPPPVRATTVRSAARVPPPDSFVLHSPYPNPFVDTARVELDLPVYCDYEFRVYDLAGREVAYQPVTGAFAGTYTLVFAPTLIDFTAYMIRAEAYDSSQVYLVDTTYVACWSPVPEQNTIGTTGLNGELLTRDSLRFPALFDVPDMTYKSEADSTLGTFRYVDSIQIQLRDVARGLQQSYTAPLTQGSNDIALSWQP